MTLMKPNVEATALAQPESKYLDGNPKTIYGTAKPSITNVPPIAFFKLGQVMDVGAKKYGPMNWRDDKITASVYINAAARHIFEYLDGADLDAETHLENLAHAAACLCILLDAKAQGTLNDDRATAGMMSAFLRTNTKTISKDTHIDQAQD